MKNNGNETTVNVSLLCMKCGTRESVDIEKQDLQYQDDVFRALGWGRPRGTWWCPDCCIEYAMAGG